MYIFNRYKLSNFFIISFYYILIILINISSADKFIDIKKLSLYDKYFVVLDTGLYLYDFNNEDFTLIHKFNENEYRSFNNAINITELNYKQKSYILCLVNEYLFLFNEYTYKLFNYKIKEIEGFNNYYYNIMPCKIENNNISFIIVLNKEIEKLFFLFVILMCVEI